MATVSFKCPNCGGGLQFDPAAQNYECEYCLSRFTQEELEKMVSENQKDAQKTEDSGEEQASPAGSQAEDTAGAVIYTCPSCGAEIVTDGTTAASFCFYCQNPVILEGRLEGRYQPDHIIPFAIDKERATEIFLDWLKKKKYVPSDFYGLEQIEKMTGVYFPYWMYSCQVEGNLEGEGTRIRVWRTGDLEYTETQKYDICRSGTMPVEHVTRNALKKADKKLVEGVMPFDTRSMKDFSMGFLSGFFAEKRDMEEKEFALEVEKEVKDFAADTLRSSVGQYNSISVRRNEARIQSPKWEYVLFPVWTLTYKEKKTGNIYYFACNGQSGKVCGKLPVDSGKLMALFGKIFLPLTAVLLIAGYLI